MMKGMLMMLEAPRWDHVDDEDRVIPLTATRPTFPDRQVLLGSDHGGLEAGWELDDQGAVAFLNRRMAD